MLLLFSLLILAFSPLLYRVSQRRPAAMHMLDGFVYASLLGLILFAVFPDAFETAGVWSVLPAALGVVGPMWLERWTHTASATAHRFALLVAVAGMSLHAVVDGVGLASAGTGHLPLATAILLHRIPVALAFWWLIRPAYGRFAAGSAIAAIGAATVAGYLYGGAAPWSEGMAFGLFQALVGGSLLHVMLHSMPVPHMQTVRLSPANWQGLGAVAGVVLVIWMLLDGGHHMDHGHALEVAHSVTDGFVARLWMLVAESAPALVLAYLAAGVIQTMFPDAAVRWLQKGNSAGQAVRGVIFGLPIPVCSCGVVPLFRALVEKGAPPAAAFAFLIATPELGLDAIFLTWPLMGADMMWVRIGAAAFVALLGGWIAGQVAMRFRDDFAAAVQQANDACCCGDTSCSNPVESAAAAPLSQRLAGAIRAGYTEILDHTAPWIVFGLVLAAAAVPVLQMEWMRSLPDWAELLAFGLVGIPVYVCAAGATPLAAVLIAYGVSPGAALAFLLTGPATNVTTFGVISDVYGKRVALVFGIVVAGLAMGSGLAVNLLAPPELGANALADTHMHASIFQQIMAAVLLLLFAGSVLRTGPRAFVSQVINLEIGHSHEDAHDHGQGNHA